MGKKGKFEFLEGKMKKLKSITIKNYKSIKNLTFNIDDKLEEQTYTLVGINESGKSTFLEALSYFDETEQIISSKFFNNENQPIEIILEYDPKSIEEEIHNDLKRRKISNNFIKQVKLKQFKIKRVFHKEEAGKLDLEGIKFEEDDIKGFTLNEENIPVLFKNNSQEENQKPKINIKDYLDKNIQADYFYNKTHIFTLWRYSEQYLINKSINLDEFSGEPNISSPLLNCFSLININKEAIPKTIGDIKSSPRKRQNISERLNKVITNHIKSVWKEHKIKIKFNIDSDKITFLVEDEEAEFVNQETDQRSDGFRQFLSFLLSISADNQNKNLQDTILLIDEPEQHLHPKACNCFRDEIINISKSNNNLVFLGTHSIFMIDEFNLDRCYKVEKKENNCTEIKKIGKEQTFSTTIYNVFGIYTTELHNELYGWIQDKEEKPKIKEMEEFLKSKYKEKLDKPYKNGKAGNESNIQKLSLSSYIRNKIHHPENTKNPKFTQEELEKSIELLMRIKKEIQKKKN